MYGTVKLRNERNYNDDKTKDRPLSGSLYLSRPKSWGEFQSGLSTFHSVPRPRKSTSSEEPEPIQVETKPANIEEKHVRRRSTPLEITPAVQPMKSGAFKSRPLSEVLVPTPFYRTFRNFNNPQNDAKTPQSQTIGQAEPTTQLVPEKLDVPSLMFEEALECENNPDTADSDLNACPNVEFEPKAYLSSLSADETNVDDDMANTKKTLNSSLTSDKQTPEGSTRMLNATNFIVASSHNPSSGKRAKENAVFQAALPVNDHIISSHVDELNELKADSCSSYKSESRSCSDSLIVSEVLPEENSDILDTDSDSSVVDTGFYSLGEFGETNNSQLIPENDSSSRFDLQDDEEMPNANMQSPSAPPRKSRPGIPSPLHSCYSNTTYKIQMTGSSSSRSLMSKSSISSSSVDFSDDESISEEPNSKSKSCDSRAYDGDRSTEESSPLKSLTKLSVPKTRDLNGYGFTLKRNAGGTARNKSSETDSTDSGSTKPFKNRTVYTQITKENMTITSPKNSNKCSDTESIDSANTKGILRNRSPVGDKHPLNISDVEKLVQADGKRPSKVKLGWKDDENTMIGGLGRANEMPEDVQTHGTWPRRFQRSKRRQDQEEAEELLRRFRATSETYRTRFRNIYEDSRRRVEETMFELRVAMAKNGYSPNCFQPNVQHIR
ncbi:uncharacterized protein LOC143462957 isoform X2 [Clavelina lepadiformis]|uniref:uncharacterized protein LOC143462957 isoform X2 n=1 Tax=Clavelina lepadiformis TaxID=159417 RepID=UPI004042A317